MKRILYILLMISLLVFAFTSCKDNDDGGADTGGGSDTGDTGDTGNGGDSGNTDGGNTGDSDGSLGEIVWSTDLTPVIVTADEADELVNDLYYHIATLTGKSPTVVGASTAESENEILIGETGRALSNKAYKRLDRLVDLLEIKNVGESAYIIYSEGGSLAVAYSDIYAKAVAIEYITENLKDATLKARGTVAHDSFRTLDFIAEKREEGRALGYANIERTLGAAALAEVKKLYSLYDEGLYVWLANLYDPTRGGFYYSGSARDTVGFLPDLESTSQATAILKNSGLADYRQGKWANLFTDEMKAQMLSFVYDMQSPDDYYYYHPQWGTSVGTSRRGRDAGSASNILEGLGKPPKYKRPNSTSTASLTGLLGQSSVVSVSKVVTVASVADELRSEKAFCEYLDAALNKGNSYSIFNNLNSRISEIKRAGLWDYLLKYLIEHQYPNGLWEPTVTYQSINGLMKVSSFFDSDTPFPNADAAIESAIQIISLTNTEEIEGIVYIYNPWVAIKNVLPYCSAESKALYTKILTDNAATLLSQTYQKLVLFKRDDGGFSYKQTGSAHQSQEVTVAVEGTKESDVNATSIAISTVLRYILKVYNNVNPPALYYKYDTLYFCQTLESMGEIIKDEAVADPEIVTFDNYYAPFGNEEGGVVGSPDDIVINNIGDKDMLGGVYTWFAAEMVPNPAEDARKSDIVLHVKDFTYPDDKYKQIASKQSSTEIAITNYTALGNCYVFESDMWYVGDCDSAAPALQFMFCSTGGSAQAAWLNFYPYEKDGTHYLRISDEWEGSDGLENNAVVGELPVGKWFKLRIELYKETDSSNGKLDMKMKIYVDGKYAGESDSCRYINGAYQNTTINAVRIAYYRQSVSEFYINNMYAARAAKSYRKEHTDSDTTISPVTYDFESEEIANGIEGYTYSTQSDAPGRETYVQSLVTKNGMPADRYGAWFSLAADPKNQDNKVLKVFSNDAKSATPGSISVSPRRLRNGNVHVIEYDYFLESNTTKGASMLQLRFVNGIGLKIGNDVTVAYCTGSTESYERGVFQLGSTSTTVDGVNTLDSGTWYRIRVAWDQGSGVIRYSYSLDGGANWYRAANDGERKSTTMVGAVELICNTYNTKGVQYIDNVSYTVTDFLPDVLEGVPDTGYDPIVTVGGSAVYDFETEALSTGEHVNVRAEAFIIAPSSDKYNEEFDRVIYNSITESAMYDGLFGISMRIAPDSTNGANKVLRMQSTHSGSLKDSVLTFAASEAGRESMVNVLEFDYYLEYQTRTGSTTPFKIQFNDENDRVIGSSFNFIQGLANPVAAKENEDAKKAFLANGVGLKSKTWYKIRVIWNQNEGTRDFYYSTDGGESFVKLGETAKNSSMKKATSVSLIFSAYNWNGVQQLDNISYKIVEEPPKMNIKVLTPEQMGTVAVGGSAVYDFETESLETGAHVIINAHVYSGDPASVTPGHIAYDKISASTNYDGRNGVSLSIATDIENSLNKVLRAVTKSAGSLTGTELTFAASSRDKEGVVNLIEFDYYLYCQTAAASATPFKIQFNNCNGDSIGSSFNLIKELTNPVSAKDYEDAKKAFLVNGVGLYTKTWYKIRIIWDQKENTRDIYCSTDGGTSFVKLGGSAEVTSDVEVHSVTFMLSAYNWTGIQQLDNISFKVLKTAPTMNVKVPDAAELGTVIPGGTAVYDFETDAMTSGEHIIFDGHAYEDSPAASNEDYDRSKHHYGYDSVSGDAKYDGKYGVSLSIATDAPDAVGRALRVQTVATSGSAATTITLAASSIAEGGRVSVLEFDYYLLYQSKAASATPFKFTYNNERGDSIGSSHNFIDSIKVAAGVSESAKEAFACNGERLETRTWYRIRIVWDSANASLSFYYSYDGGETYLKAGEDVKKSGDVDVKSVTLIFSAYNWESVQYLDNVSFKVLSEAPTYVEGTKPEKPVDPDPDPDPEPDPDPDPEEPKPEEPSVPEEDGEAEFEGNIDGDAWEKN